LVPFDESGLFAVMLKMFFLREDLWGAGTAPDGNGTKWLPGIKILFLMHSGFSALEPGGRACLHEHLSFERSLGAPMKNGLARIFGRILLTLGGLAAAGFLLLVLIGFGDRYEKETKALGFSGLYERYRASGAGFPNDPQGYREAAKVERARQGTGDRVAAIEE
jgi:hypothetical protein